MGKPKTNWELIGIAWEIAGMVALPLIGFALIGRWVDHALGTNTIFFLVGAGLAMLISGIIIWFRISSLLHDL